MWDVVVRRVREGAPFLGICLGLQLLADTGLRRRGVAGPGPGAGIVRAVAWGREECLISAGTRCSIRASACCSTEFPEDTAFYFVHSYRLKPEETSCIIGSAEYGVRFAAAVQITPKAFAVQFHPEKSSDRGLQLLSNFGRIVEGQIA